MPTTPAKASPGRSREEPKSRTPKAHRNLRDIAALDTLADTTPDKLGWLGIDPDCKDRRLLARAKALHVSWQTMQAWLALCWLPLRGIMRGQHCLRRKFRLPPPWKHDQDAAMRERLQHLLANLNIVTSADEDTPGQAEDLDLMEDEMKQPRLNGQPAAAGQDLESQPNRSARRTTLPDGSLAPQVIVVVPNDAGVYDAADLERPGVALDLSAAAEALSAALETAASASSQAQQLPPPSRLQHLSAILLLCARLRELLASPGGGEASSRSSSGASAEGRQTDAEMASARACVEALLTAQAMPGTPQRTAGLSSGGSAALASALAAWQACQAPRSPTSKGGSSPRSGSSSKASVRSPRSAAADMPLEAAHRFEQQLLRSIASNWIPDIQSQLAQHTQLPPRPSSPYPPSAASTPTRPGYGSTPGRPVASTPPRVPGSPAPFAATPSRAANSSVRALADSLHKECALLAKAMQEEVEGRGAAALRPAVASASALVQQGQRTPPAKAGDSTVSSPGASSTGRPQTPGSAAPSPLPPSGRLQQGGASTSASPQTPTAAARPLSPSYSFGGTLNPIKESSPDEHGSARSRPTALRPASPYSSPSPSGQQDNSSVAGPRPPSASKAPWQAPIFGTPRRRATIGSLMSTSDGGSSSPTGGSEVSSPKGAMSPRDIGSRPISADSSGGGMSRPLSPRSGLGRPPKGLMGSGLRPTRRSLVVT